MRDIHGMQEFQSVEYLLHKPFDRLFFWNFVIV